MEIKICLMKDFTLPTPEDLLLLPFQAIQIKIPPTQLTSNTKTGSLKINFSDHNVRWEAEREINSRMAKIITDRKTHEIKPGNGAHRREQNWMPSAPIGYQPSFNQAWGWQDQNNSGGWIPRDAQGPCYGELGWMPRMVGQVVSHLQWVQLVTHEIENKCQWQGTWPNRTMWHGTPWLIKNSNPSDMLFSQLWG